MKEFFTRVQMEGAAAIIRNRSRYQPTVGIVLGSGLSELADEVQYPDIIPTAQIPHWPGSSVQGHTGRLVLGRLEDQVVLVMQGRSHFYEGYSMSQITLPVRVMAILGIHTLIVTNAAGGLNKNFNVGDLMLINDHLNLPGLAGQNPLRGPNDESSGPRFPDMSNAYDAGLRQAAHHAAGDAGFSLHEGIYTYVAGPSYETPAELRYLRMIGGDAVGMSTVPSVIVARHSGLRVLGISSITNIAVTDPKDGQETSHEEVLEAGKIAVPKLKQVIRGVLSQMDSA